MHADEEHVLTHAPTFCCCMYGHAHTLQLLEEIKSYNRIPRMWTPGNCDSQEQQPGDFGATTPLEPSSAGLRSGHRSSEDDGDQGGGFSGGGDSSRGALEDGQWVRMECAGGDSPSRYVPHTDRSARSPNGERRFDLLLYKRYQRSQSYSEAESTRRMELIRAGSASP